MEHVKICVKEREREIEREKKGKRERYVEIQNLPILLTLLQYSYFGKILGIRTAYVLANFSGKQNYGMLGQRPANRKCL
jgi:hypothetical protein